MGIGNPIEDGRVPLAPGCEASPSTACGVLAESHPSREELASVAAAIDAARQLDREGPFGLFDYTAYGAGTPHHVRDFRTQYICTPAYGRCVFQSTDRDEAFAEYERLTAEHIALAAWNAVASAMSARSAEPEGLSPQDASATAESRDAQTLSPNSTQDTQS